MCYQKQHYVTTFLITALTVGAILLSYTSHSQAPRQRISINNDWRFTKGDPAGVKGLSYDVRPDVTDRNDNIIADSKPTEGVAVKSADTVLKKWILPSANSFINDVSKHHQRPTGNPGGDVSVTQSNFNDSEWEKINLPHDWAINGPFYKEANAIVGGGMGRLPVQGIGWYRKKINIPSSDKGKTIYLDIDGAMSYAIVWCNGNLVGGWPYGYNSFRLDLTPYVKPGGENQIAIRLDNPTNSARWYPGGGIYRNVWLTKVNPVHVAHWGTYITTKNVSASSATIDLAVQIENKSTTKQNIRVTTELFLFDAKLKQKGNKVGSFTSSTISVNEGAISKVDKSVTIKNPLLWGPAPEQKPNLYVAVTRLYANGKLIDEYQTQFGIRSLNFDPVKGLFVNGKPVRMQGVNQHHDLGALGAAFNTIAAERQLEILRELGCNAIRLAHNPPAPELLELTDRMVFLLID